MILYFEWIKFSYEISNILTFKFRIKSFHIKYNLWNDISNTSNFKSNFLGITVIASLSTQYIFSEMILQGDNTYADVVSWGEISPPVVVVFWGGWRLV